MFWYIDIVTKGNVDTRLKDDMTENMKWNKTKYHGMKSVFWYL